MPETRRGYDREFRGGGVQGPRPAGHRGTGYVVGALEAALWPFRSADDCREGALLAVNLGDDAGTTGAIYAQIAGAHHGAESIRAIWRTNLTVLTEITALADQLHDRATNGA